MNPETETKTQSSGDEKYGAGGGGELENGSLQDQSQYALPPDPDAHLSLEEKKAVVSFFQGGW